MASDHRALIPAMLSIIITIGFFSILIGVLMGWMRASESQALLLMLGSLTSGWGMVMAFWFGTTSDSRRKTELLAQSQPVTKEAVDGP